MEPHLTDLVPDGLYVTDHATIQLASPQRKVDPGFGMPVLDIAKPSVVSLRGQDVHETTVSHRIQIGP